MSFERDRVLMLRTALAEEQDKTQILMLLLAEERAHSALLAQALNDVTLIEHTDFDHVVGYEAAVLVIVHRALKMHKAREQGGEQ